MDHSMMGMNHDMHDMAGMADMAAGSVDYTLTFIAGFLGSGHCLGMCGALVSGYFMNTSSTRSYLPYLMYQLTRIMVYTLIGFAAASLGVVLVSSGIFGKIQSLLQMFIGIVVITLAFGILGWIPFQGSIRLIPLSLLRKGYANSKKRGPIIGAMLAGLLNGLMPCPLTFAMAVKATTAPTILEGGLLMLTFGAGTLPMMLFISVAFGKIKANVRGLMLKIAAFIMLFMGFNTFYRGLSFYVDQNFKHHNYFYLIKEKIDLLIGYLHQFILYLTDLITTLQSM
jgi:sulfite exporter TauE/SafE